MKRKIQKLQKPVYCEWCHKKVKVYSNIDPRFLVYTEKRSYLVCGNCFYYMSKNDKLP